MDTSLLSKLKEIQHELKVEKSQWNDFSGFYYRSKEDILEALKPLAHERGCVIICEDKVECLENGWVYCTTTASLIDCDSGESVSSTGIAREPESKKGMDTAQITGTASSYAGKRALGNLFAIDDTADSDSPSVGKSVPSGPFTAHCKTCGARYTFHSAEQMQAMQCCASPNYEVE